MKTDNLSIEEQVARLPHRDRARLALRLIESLDPGKDEDVADLWLNEVAERLKRYDDGATTARDAELAISEIERRLR